MFGGNSGAAFSSGNGSFSGAPSVAAARYGGYPPVPGNKGTSPPPSIDLTGDNAPTPTSSIELMVGKSDAEKMFDRMKKRSFARSGVITEVDVESGVESQVRSPHAKKRYMAANRKDQCGIIMDIVEQSILNDSKVNSP